MQALLIVIFITSIVTSVPFYYGGDFEYPDIYEEVVPLECTDLEIPCEADHKCLQFSDFCNGETNCSDNLDERDCHAETTIASDSFTDLVQVSEAETTSSYQTYHYYYETTAAEV